MFGARGSKEMTCKQSPHALSHNRRLLSHPANQHNTTQHNEREMNENQFSITKKKKTTKNMKGYLTK